MSSDAQREARKRTKERASARWAAGTEEARRYGRAMQRGEFTTERTQRDGKRTIDVMAQRREPGGLTFEDWERWS